MTDQTRVDWTLSYLARHANDPKRRTRDPIQPSLYDALTEDEQAVRDMDLLLDHIANSRPRPSSGQEKP